MWSTDCDKDYHKLLVHFQKKDGSTKRIEDGASGQDGPRSNQIKQGDGSSYKHYQLFQVMILK